MIKIYVLKDPRDNSIRYVGKTINSLNKRLSNHMCDKRRNHRTSWIKSLKNIELKPIIEEIDSTEDFDFSSILETNYIKHFKEKGFNLVNHTDGGEGTIGRKATEDQKRNQSLRMKGTGIGSMNSFYNKKHSEETKRKISIANLGKKRSKEVKDKMSIAQKMRKPRKKFTEINKLYKKVIQKTIDGDFIKEWMSIKETKKNGFSQSNVSRCCNNKRKTHAGFKWEFKEN